MTWCRKLLLSLAVLAGLITTQAYAQPRPNVTGPRVVLQSRPMGIDVAVWTPDGRYIIAASSIDREILVIDVATLHVLDRRFIPATIHPDGLMYLQLESMSLTPDGRSVLIHGVCAKGPFDLAEQTRDFLFNLSSRRITLRSEGTATGRDDFITRFRKRLSDIQAIYEPDTDGASDVMEATGRLPKLPDSPDGRYHLERMRNGLRLRTVTDGSNADREIFLSGVSSFNDAALAVDGKRLVLVDYHSGSRESEKTTIRRLDVTTGRFEPALTVESDFGFVHWIDDDRVLLVSNSDDGDRDPDDQPTAPQAMIMSWSAGRILQHLDGYCFVKPAGDGDFIAAGPGNCSPDRKAERGVFRYDHRTSKWFKLPIADLTGKFINGLTVSDNGKLIALVVEDAKTDTFIFVEDAFNGQEKDQLSFENGQGAMTGEPRFDPSATRLYVPANTVIAEWQFGTAVPARQIDTRTSMPQFVLVDRGQVMASGLMDSSIARASVKDGAALPDLNLDRAIAGGFVEGKNLFWAVSQSQGFRLWDTRDWRLVLSTYVFPGIAFDNAFLTVTPDGRFDTNLDPDAAPFRWIVDDAPFQSLAPQTFMRDYFTPRLGQKQVDCLVANDCAQALPPVRPIASLNRLLPKVEAIEYVPGEEPGKATVIVRLSETIDPSVRGRPTRSGAFDLRLFINGRMVSHKPWQLGQMAGISEEENVPPIEVSNFVNASIDNWRKVTQLDMPEDGSTGSVEFNISVPTQPTNGNWDLTFSAYAFNSDRAKGETFYQEVSRQPMAPRPRRAYVIAVGVSRDASDRLYLPSAASDAHLMASRLAAIDGYEVRNIALTGERLANGQVRKVNAMDIEFVLGALAKGSVTETRMRMKALGIDPNLLAPATPDDVVIFSFSGHGWADPAGNFYLLGSDAVWPESSPEPDRESLLSIMHMIGTIDDINAGEITIIIDACHSAASVDTSDFKPGPMGDASLGQLAYDKKVRILAATQGDDIALETATIGHGLLSWALAGEGLRPDKPAADFNGDGKVTLSEWLTYANRRLPGLSREQLTVSTASSASDDDGLVFVNRVKPKPKLQEPALFDFNREASRLVLNGAAR